jgi:hypothetical protein
VTQQSLVGYGSAPRPRLLVALAVLALGLASCGPSTELVTWKDPAFTGPGFRSVLVMAMTDNLTGRSAIEQAIAQKLEQRKINAVQSLSLFSPDAKPSYDTLEVRLSEMGIDGILIVEPIGKEDIERYTEGITYYDTYSTYIDTRSSRLAHRQDPGQVQVIGTIYRARSSLYANNTDQLVWRGESETPFYGDLQTSARDFASSVVTALESSGMLRPPPAPRVR